MRRSFNRNGSSASNGHGRPAVETPVDIDSRIQGLPVIKPIDRYDSERWYPIQDISAQSRSEIVNCLSVTTVLDCYPKSPFLLDWMKKQGQMADQIRDERARVGMQVDRLTQLLDRGGVLERDQYSREVYKAVLSYHGWRAEFDPQILAQQRTVYSIQDRVAGTIDKLARIDGDLHLIEVKATSGIYPTHLLQAQVYAHLLNLMGIPVKYADVLRLGTKHKAGYEFKKEEYDPAIFNDVFMACRTLWLHSHDGRDYPMPEEKLPDSISIPQPTNGSLVSREPTNGRATWNRRPRR